MFAAILFGALSLFTTEPVHASGDCTQIGCENGVFIDVPQNYRWVAGKYQFRFLLDSTEVLCEGRLPLPPCGRNAIHCTKPGISIMESGCALPPAEQGFGRITIDSFPRHVSLTITRNGRRLGGLEFAPVFTESRPNGPHCEPVCRQDRPRLIELR